MFNLGTGLAKGIYEGIRGEDERREYNELQAERERRRQFEDKQLTQLDNVIAMQNMQIKELKQNQMRQEAGMGKLRASDAAMNVIRTLASQSGKMAQVKEETISGDNLPENFDKSKYNYDETTNTYHRAYKDYSGISPEVAQSVAELKKALVYDPQASNWINNYLDTVDNPVTDVTYRPESGELVLTKKSGDEMAFSPGMFYGAMGFDKQASYADQNAVKAQMEADERQYQANKRRLDLLNDNFKIQTEKNRAVKYASDVQLNNVRMQKESAITKKYLKEISEGKPLSPNQLKIQEEQARKKSKEDLAAMANDKNLTDSDYAKIVSETPGALDSLRGTKANDKDKFDKAVKGGTLLQQQAQLRGMVEVIGDTAGKNSMMIDDVGLATLENYGIKLRDNSLTSLINATKVYAEQLAARSVTFLSGAAFTEQEMKTQLGAINAIQDGETAKAALEKINSNMNSWSQLVATESAPFSAATKKVIRGLAVNSIENGEVMLDATNKGYEDYVLRQADKVFSGLKTDEEKLKAFNNMPASWQNIIRNYQATKGNK